MSRIAIVTFPLLLIVFFAAAALSSSPERKETDLAAQLKALTEEVRLLRLKVAQLKSQLAEIQAASRQAAPPVIQFQPVPSTITPTQSLILNLPKNIELPPVVLAVPKIVPLKLGASIPLSVQSAGVTWKGYTYHLVNLGSIKSCLDKNECLKADIQAGVTLFDNVNYDISAAVFDDAGQMLGSARAQCEVQRIWTGNVKSTARTITLDFGVSSDYTRAATCAVSVSNRKVLTPDDWQR